MKITKVEPMVLRAGPIDPTRPDGTQDAFLVRVHTDEDLIGIGEGDTAPFVAHTIVAMPASHSVAQGLGEMLAGKDPRQVRRRWDEMYHGSYHYGRDGAALHAMSAIDMALWDLAGKIAGSPVSELLGGRRVDEVEVYASEVMPESSHEVAAIAARVVEQGLEALKLGWGPLGRDVGRDIELATAAREVLGAGRRLMLDGGMAYTVASARELCRKAEPLELFWLEEPFGAEDVASYRRLADTVSVRIACGEALSTLGPFRSLLEEGHVDVLQPDLGRCGGFTVAAEIAVLAGLHGVEIVPHSFSTDVLLAASLHFSSTLPRLRLVEFPVTTSAQGGSLLSEPLRPLNGRLSVPTGPGLGIVLDEDEINRRRVL